MFKIQSDTRLISFDGTVLEIFLTRGETKRFHVDLIQSIDLEERKGSYSLALEYTSFNAPEKFGVDGVNIGQAEALVHAVQQALS